MQITLPASASRELMAQDAPKNGTMFFEVTTQGGGRTHTGVLSFTAPEGSAGLPPHVVASLWPDGRLPTGETVTVTYRRLEKGRTPLSRSLCMHGNPYKLAPIQMKSPPGGEGGGNLCHRLMVADGHQTVLS